MDDYVFRLNDVKYDGIKWWEKVLLWFKPICETWDFAEFDPPRSCKVSTKMMFGNMYVMEIKHYT